MKWGARFHGVEVAVRVKKRKVFSDKVKKIRISEVGEDGVEGFSHVKFLPDEGLYLLLDGSIIFFAPFDSIAYWRRYR